MLAEKSSAAPSTRGALVSSTVRSRSAADRAGVDRGNWYRCQELLAAEAANSANLAQLGLERCDVGDHRLRSMPLSSTTSSDAQAPADPCVGPVSVPWWGNCTLRLSA
jgi:hypothetical protein